LGAIGQLAAQLARLAGACWVVVIDPIERRRSAAMRHGADAALDPREVDAAVEIKGQTDRLGGDVAVETSGASDAFYDALRAIRYQGTVVSTAYYTGPLEGLFFSGEWHRNRPHLVSSRAYSEPLPDYGWDFAGIEAEALARLVGSGPPFDAAVASNGVFHLVQGRLQADDLIDPVVPFSQAAEAYMEINEHPERSIKLGITHE